MIHYNPSSTLFPLLDGSELLFIFDCFSYETSGISLDEHELKNINLFVSHPGMIKLLQIAAHVFKDILDGDIDLFHYALVDVSDDLLNHLELLEQFATCFEHILRENILLSIHPEVRESFLG